jgi:DNA topoisomerase I
MSYTAIIVESPAKCKKIESFLGPGYKAMASYGHIRSLNGLKSIDIKNNFKPTYDTIDEKSKQLQKIKSFIESASDVLLASDDDREGEAIAWHICDLFNLPIETTKRIVFHEITETAIKHAVKNPTNINMDLVQAQQARQILDLIVGFKISPILWSNIDCKKSSSLSAGRCQTPALRLIYENEMDILNSPGKKVYNTVGYFTSYNIPFTLNYGFENEEQVKEFLEKTVNFEHIYSVGDVKAVEKKPPSPFTTSILQQVSSNELRLSPKQTMDACQKLYEAGYITYMRTDSKFYSGDFIKIINEFIYKTYGDNYTTINGNVDIPKKKNTLAQEAHEAIRPTNIYCQEVKQTSAITNREARVYNLIRRNTLESCMCNAKFNTFISKIQAPLNKEYKYMVEQIVFPGWKIVSGYDKETPYFNYLQKISQNSIVHYKKINCKVSIKELKNHYTEARLVQLLEEKGIGRPSTFSSLVEKIQERGYVKKDNVVGMKTECIDYELDGESISQIINEREFGGEKNKLILQPLGKMVIEFLIEPFNDIFNYDYTKNMEDSLDLIAKKELLWHELCRSCLNNIDKIIKPIKQKNKDKIIIDEENTYMISRYGPVIKRVKDGKTKFLKVKEGIDIEKLKRKEYSLNEILVSEGKPVSNTRLLGEMYDKNVFLKKGRFGLYIEWGDAPTNSKISLNKKFKNSDEELFEKLTLEDIQEYLIEQKPRIRELGKNASIRVGNYGPYIYFKTEKMKNPKFVSLKGFKHDYEKCDFKIISEWLKTKHKIYI